MYVWGSRVHMYVWGSMYMHAVHVVHRVACRVHMYMWGSMYMHAG